jgi:hypothetical protein
MSYRVRYDDKLFHVTDEGGEADATKGWSFQFGAYGTTRVVVLAGWGVNSLDDALEAAAEVVAKVAPGVFHTEAVHEAYRESIAAGADEETAMEEAETDMTSVLSGNEYIPSWEWYVHDIHQGDPIFTIAKAVLARHEDDD